MRKLNRKGFTLVELMVVLAILGLLALVGIPQYTQVMERARIGRDLAQIATVQTVVTAFVTETDWLEKNDAPRVLLFDKEGKVESITANSYLTGGEVKLEDFFEEGFKAPELESKTAQGGNWYIGADGTVYVEKEGGGRLPGDNNASDDK